MLVAEVVKRQMSSEDFTIFNSEVLEIESGAWNVIRCDYSVKLPALHSLLCSISTSKSAEVRMIDIGGQFANQK